MWAIKVLAKVRIFKVWSIKTKLLRMKLDISDSLKTTNRLIPTYWFQFKQYFYKIYNISQQLFPKACKKTLWIHYTGIQWQNFYVYSTITHSLQGFFNPPWVHIHQFCVIYVTKLIVTLKYFIAHSNCLIFMLLIVLWLLIGHWALQEHDYLNSYLYASGHQLQDRPLKVQCGE